MRNMPATTDPTQINGKAPGMPSDLRKVAQHMARLNVAGLPRNYELFHAALFERDGELSRDVAALPVSPTQAHLDELGLKHRLVGHCGIAVEKTQAEAARLLQRLHNRLHATLAQKRALIRALEAVTRSFGEEDQETRSHGFAELHYLSQAITELVLAETDASRAIEQDAQTLESLSRGVAAAQATVLRDPLTALPNRIAFANRMASLYNAGEEPAGTALIVADIDQFAALNAKYGQAVCNRLLKRLASIFRKSIKKDDFVARIGGDEFAFIFSGVCVEASHVIAERLRAAVEDNLVFATSDAADRAGLTISLGVALSDHAASAAQLQTYAEAALAIARANPRSPVIIHDPVAARRGAKGPAIRAVR